MPVKCELPAKIGRCSKNLAGRNFDFRAKSSWEKIFNIYKNFSQEDFAIKSKLWPLSFFQHLPIFAGNSRSTVISQLRAGKTRSKRPRSHWLSTVHLLPYMWASFYPLDPSQYLSSFSSWRPKSKKTKPSKQCKSLIWILIFAFEFICILSIVFTQYTPAVWRVISNTLPL